MSARKLSTAEQSGAIRHFFATLFTPDQCVYLTVALIAGLGLVVLHYA